jgi:hypothetical protein
MVHQRVIISIIIVMFLLVGLMSPITYHGGPDNSEFKNGFEKSGIHHNEDPLTLLDVNSDQRPIETSRTTRGAEDLEDFKLKWLDGYGTIIGYMNSIKTADVDGDSEPEIVFGNSEGYVYVVGQNQGEYVEEWHAMVDVYAFGLALADVDSDGTIEIIVGDSEGYINIFGYNGDSYENEWTSWDLGSDVYGLTADDVDGDGMVEIIVGCSVSEILQDNIFVLSYNGNTYEEEWSFTLTITLGYLGLFHVDVGDVDGDSQKEIVFASYESEVIANDPPINPIPPNPRPNGQFGGRFYVFGYSDGSGSLEWQSDDFGEWIMGMDVDNTDSDFGLEIVISVYFGDIFVFGYVGIGYAVEWQGGDISAYALTVGPVHDMPGARIIASGWERIHVFESQGVGYNQVWESEDLDSMVYGLGTGDVTGDGVISEILTGTNYRFYAYRHESVGDVYEIEIESSNIGAIDSISSGDLDNDGTRELYMGMGSGDVIVSHFNGASLITESTISLSSREITHIGLGDVDDDGSQEIIAIEGHSGVSWNENFVFRSASSDAFVHIIGYDGSDYVVEDGIQVDVGAAFCSDIGDVDSDGVPEILLGGTGFDEVNEDPFVGQIEVIDYDGQDYSVSWESFYFDNWVMGVAIGNVDDDEDNEIVTEDYDENLGSNVLRLFEWNGNTYVEFQTVNIDSENFALDVGDSDGDMSQEIATKGIFDGLLEVFGSGSSYPQEWSSSQYTTFIDECMDITNLEDGGDEYLIFGELGVFVYEYTGSGYQQIWHTQEIPASVKNIHVEDIDDFSGKDIVGSSGGYNFIYGEGGQPIASLSVSDTSVAVDENVIFDGSQSTGSGQLDYFFDFGDGSNSGWIGNSQTTHSYSSEGTYVATLRVRDQGGTQSPDVDSKTIFVSPGAGKPVAIIDSIAPSPSLQGETVTFTGHGEGEGAIVDYEWSSNIQGFLGDSPSIQYTGLPNGDHVISFKVRNDIGEWSEDSQKTLTVSSPPEAEIDSISPSTPNFGDLVTFKGSGTDDGDIVGYDWSSNVDGFLSNQDTFSYSGLSAGAHIISLKVRDDDGLWSEDDSKSLYINEIPVATIESVDPDEAIVSDVVIFSGSGEDDGSITAYNWESDIDGFLSSRAEFSTFSLSTGVHTISFTVRDNRDVWSEPDTWTVTIEEEPENIPPVAIIESVSPAKSKEGEDVTFVGEGMDLDGRIKEYFWESDLDGFLSGERTFTTDSLSKGFHKISFSVRDDRGDWSEVMEVVVEVEEKEEESQFLGIDFSNFNLDSFNENTEMCFLMLIILIIVILVIVAAVISARNKRRRY